MTCGRKNLAYFQFRRIVYRSVMNLDHNMIRVMEDNLSSKIIISLYCHVQLNWLGKNMISFETNIFSLKYWIIYQYFLLPFYWKIIDIYVSHYHRLTFSNQTIVNIEIKLFKSTEFRYDWISKFQAINRWLFKVQSNLSLLVLNQIMMRNTVHPKQFETTSFCLVVTILNKPLTKLRCLQISEIV